MSNLNLMVVGVGALGRHHARILSGLDGVTLAVVADPREEIGRPIAEQFGARWVRDFRDALNSVDAASVVVPTSLHVPVASEFLSRSIPVLVEKPLAASGDDARLLTQMAAENSCVLQVGHVERFNPAYLAAKERVRQPRLIRTERFSPFPFRSMDIGAVHDLLIHDIDLVLDLVQSEVVAVQSFGVSAMSAYEDVVNARLTFASGCIADLTANRINPTACRRMQIWSESGRVDVDFQTRQLDAFEPSLALQTGLSPVELASQPGADLDQLKRDVFGRFIQIETPDISSDDALTAELNEFVNCVRTGSRPSCSGEEALDALQVAERVLAGMSRCDWRDGGQSMQRAA
ncbi:gfo/Idh/MocA family oxidoreductase [bacterium]|nr:gfo/Idh/MocA family oxidoreductase [bacterium]